MISFSRAAFPLALLAAVLAPAQAQQAATTIEPPQLAGSRPIEKPTETEVLRDYLRAWDSMNAALGTNDPALLGGDFVGTAREKLAATIADQAKAGLQTHYRVLSHDLRFVFYSPEGQSIQLTDDVVYEQAVSAADKQLASQQVQARYLVVLTPAEVRWQVRVLQTEPGK